ncbi:MAG: hypothetical protein Wins2KO_05870 [Winogradskyella sp.]
MKTFLTFLVFILSLFLPAQDYQIKKIDSIINSKITETEPGIMVGIVKNGEVIYEKYRGLANVEHQVRISEKTRSNIASTAKQFTALMILKLSLEGKLSLEDDIRKYLTDIYPKVKEDIKIRHLINHTSGIRDYVELMGLNDIVWWKRVGLDNNDVMELLKKQNDLGFQSGSQFSYSNSGYVVLAKIIEAVSNQKFTDYSSQFFKSLGMTETNFIRRYMQVIPNRANPYSDWGYGELFHSISVTKTAGEGFLYTTLNDQLHFEKAIQNAQKNNNELLLKSQQTIPNSTINTYGFGLKLDDILNRKAIHHDGVTNAYNAQTLRFPDEQLTIFIMSNNGNLRSDILAKQIASVLLPKIDKDEQYNTAYFDKTATSKKVEIEGQYNYPTGDKLVRIVKENDTYYWKEGNYYNLEMRLESANKFAFVYNPKLKIVFYNDKMIEYYASGKTMTYQRSNEKTASPKDLLAFEGSYTNSELDISFELKLDQENNLKFWFGSEKNQSKTVQVINQNRLLVFNYVFKAQRDQFNRITEIRMDYERAKNMLFKKTSSLKYHPIVELENGSIQVTTISSKNGDMSDILLTKNYNNGNEEWSKRFGGKSYDKANSLIATDDGYLIIGSTSSYGKGNYDIYVIKTDKNGKKIWQNTYGNFYNDYGYTAEITSKGYIIKGTTQDCPNNYDIKRKCKTNVWFVEIDSSGNEINNAVLEEIHQ